MARIKPRIRKQRSVKITTALLEAMGWSIEETPTQVVAKLEYEEGPSRRLDYYVLKKRQGGEWTLGHQTLRTVRDLMQYMYNAGYDAGKFDKLKEVRQVLGFSHVLGFS